MKGEISLFSKSLLIVIISVGIIFSSFLFFQFFGKTVELKKGVKFKNEVLKSLLNIVSKNCLGMEKLGNIHVLNVSKILEAEIKYKGIELECERPIDFDYDLKIIQFEKNYKAYPGKYFLPGDLTFSGEFSSHPFRGFSKNEYVPYFECNFDPKKHPELCKQSELDRIICGDCRVNPKENCPYEKVKRICCIYYMCPRDACESVEIKKGAGDCSGGCIVVKGCDLSKCKWYPWHGACGMTYEEKEIKFEKEIEFSLPLKTWEFGFSLGVSQYSPENAKYNEIVLSLPVILWYNETFSVDGAIYIHAVKGELEIFYGILQYICDKAKIGEEREIKRKIMLSYPIKIVNNKVCMLDNCKNLDCDLKIRIPLLEPGEHYLTFRYNKNKNLIEVIE